MRAHGVDEDTVLWKDGWKDKNSCVRRRIGPWGTVKRIVGKPSGICFKPGPRRRVFRIGRNIETIIIYTVRYPFDCNSNAALWKTRDFRVRKICSLICCCRPTAVWWSWSSDGNLPNVFGTFNATTLYTLSKCQGYGPEMVFPVNWGIHDETCTFSFDIDWNRHRARVQVTY